MIWIIVMVVLSLIGSHYMAYVLGEYASTARWMRNLRELQARFDSFMEKTRAEQTRKVEVKSKKKTVTKVKINKKK